MTASDPCSAWYPNLNKNFKSKLQTMQSKFIRFCLQLDSRSHIGIKEFEQINWLPVFKRFNQFICSKAIKFFTRIVFYIYMIYKNK